MSNTVERCRRFLRIGKVADLTGLPPSTVYAKMQAGSFPKSVILGPRTKVWLEEEVIAWQIRHIAAREMV